MLLPEPRLVGKRRWLHKGIFIGGQNKGERIALLETLSNERL